ncbi:hypothetical protein [Asticcacaulis sp.]|uniref:hypothetical protein n=1 Tax=Asticcacaulis sp. TaxID=1872648 RepID=UPI0031DD9324
MKALLVIVAAASFCLAACASNHPLAYGLPNFVETDGKLFELSYKRRGHNACLVYQEVLYLRSQQPAKAPAGRKIGPNAKICADNFDLAFDRFNEETARKPLGRR